jgi:hypothetical protein
VEPQRGKQADHTVRDPLCDLDERVLRGVRVIAGSVDRASLALHLTLADKLVQPLTRNVALLEASRAHHSESVDH